MDHALTTVRLDFYPVGGNLVRDQPVFDHLRPDPRQFLGRSEAMLGV